MLEVLKTSSKNQLFMLVLYNHYSDGKIEIHEVNKLLKIFNYNNSIMDDFIKNNFFKLSDNIITITPEIASELNELYLQYSDYNSTKMGNIQKHYISRIGKEKLSLSTELKIDDNFSENILPLIKSKQITIDLNGIVIKNI